MSISAERPNIQTFVDTNVGDLTVSQLPNGTPTAYDGHNEAGVVLIDALPLRCASTFQLLSVHFPDATQTFASAAEFLTYASTGVDTPPVVLMGIGGCSVVEEPFAENLRLIHRTLPTLPVIVLSDREEVQEVMEAFRQGVRGYIPTSLTPRLVIYAIRIVLAGGTFYPADQLIRARQLIRPDAECAPYPPRVTAEHRAQWPPRQLEVLSMLAQSMPNKRIAQILAIEEGTVKVHLRQIMRKLGVANRTQAALAARRLGIAPACETPSPG